MILKAAINVAFFLLNKKDSNDAFFRIYEKNE
ncbi:hypothetical protein SAMN04487928_11083 [Butyrivibrio proteoclasticus]|uniref:Uncharacterized protein n=1 Tax=Butyrivibrio proteoclasticus TaxID=43305 RepID=A0A1I5TZD9_9FIRM|nr:hypothetical protein SAMN04487928_11083 [Butyrivibrio proteoclasticus]